MCAIRFRTIILFLLLAIPSTWACDFCAIYVANHSHEQNGLGLDVGVSESFSRFATLQQDGQKIANPLGQYLNSFTTQVFANVRPLEDISFQINLPVIYRTFKRAENGAAQSGSEFGIGDVSLLGNYLAFHSENADLDLDIHLLGGIKLPTGSSDRLHEELHEHTGPGPESGIHGHDLTLGSGSVDGILASSIHGNWKRILFSGNMQYNIRSRGSIDYRFANDLQWNIAPGYYVLLNYSQTLALQARVSGEYKKTDDLAGSTADDTGITSVFVGPNFIYTWSSRMNLNAGLDWPVLIHNTALQSVIDYRVRAAVTWNF